MSFNLYDPFKQLENYEKEQEKKRKRNKHGNAGNKNNGLCYGNTEEIRKKNALMKTELKNKYKK